MILIEIRTQDQKAWSGIEPRHTLLNFDQKKKDGHRDSNPVPKGLIKTIDPIEILLK